MSAESWGVPAQEKFRGKGKRSEFLPLFIITTIQNIRPLALLQPFGEVQQGERRSQPTQAGHVLVKTNYVGKGVASSWTASLN